MSEKLRVVMAGCGAISGTWLDSMAKMDDIDVVGFIDLDESNARGRADEFSLNDAQTGTDLDTMLDGLKPDAVFDCTVPEAHIDVTLTALKHGCHVLGEKPMSNSLENGRKMVAAAHEAGKLYAVIQNQRYNPAIRRLKSFLDQGIIGDPTMLNCDFYLGAHFGGFRERMDHVLLLDMAVHTFDAARFISDGDPVSVYCKEFNPKGSWYKHGAAAVAVFEMKDGLVFTYRGSWCAEGMNTNWTSDWRVVGEKGSVLWDGADDFKAQTVGKHEGLVYSYDDAEVPVPEKQDDAQGHEGLIREFAECVRTGATPETICTDNIKSLAMVLGAIDSAETGMPVEIG